MTPVLLALALIAAGPKNARPVKKPSGPTKPIAPAEAPAAPSVAPAAPSVAPAVPSVAPARTLPPPRGELTQAMPPTDQTDCGACHKTNDWRSVTFAHERTGFPLRGFHAKATCSDCHTRGLDTRITQACSSCHKDPHAGTLGMHCESCHDEESFRSAFSADAHRRSNFPLTGKHAVIPCEQCHGASRERTFSRVAAQCVACHQADYDATATRTIDHAAAGYSLECRTCHGVSRFTPAVFPEHDRCFQFAGTPHAGFACRDCHTSLTGQMATGLCSTGTAACSACHTHDCSITDVQHQKVPGYQCKDRKCYECHRFSR
jgi:hypothetical protein